MLQKFLENSTEIRNVLKLNSFRERERKYEKEMQACFKTAHNNYAY